VAYNGNPLRLSCEQQVATDRAKATILTLSSQC
jgi:hypothetical protein